MKKLGIILAAFVVLAFIFSPKAKANKNRAKMWTELNGQWQCYKRPDPSFHASWTCPNGDEPDCYIVICTSRDSNDSADGDGQTIGHGCCCRPYC